MAAILKAIPGNIIDAGKGVYNTISLAGEKFSKGPLCQRTVGVAAPYFQTAASYWPKPLRVRVFSKEFLAGFATAMTAGAVINKVRAPKP